MVENVSSLFLSATNENQGISLLIMTNKVHFEVKKWVNMMNGQLKMDITEEENQEVCGRTIQYI